ncbi:MAG: hybrid sensor histidine kinase/response regulator, partial [Patescibacteria group bacterium]|nr:hybrid sensor histidine kinase/response regulator [Patescibacteria group bacterium]
ADVIAGLDAGADDYVSKPYNSRILLARLEAVLRVKKAQDTVRRANARLRGANELLDTRNKQLAEINERAYQFVNNVSHDFRSPLGAIKEFATIIGDGLAGEVTSDQRDYLGIIGNCADDLAMMVDDMLDISKLEAGLLSVRRTTCSVEDVFQRVRPAVDRKAAAQQIELIAALDPNLPAVYCDPQKIGRVIINLVVNAIKFSDERGKVTVWARADEAASQVIVGVTDEGHGISPQNLQRIFERFQQVGVNARASAEGVGLGLNIVKELVGMNYGQVSVESEVGKGSTFSFTLPMTNPRKLLDLHLEQAGATRGNMPYVSLLAARLPDACDGKLAAEVDQLLHDTLRSSDLVLWAGRRCWLIVVEVGQVADIKAIMNRLERSHEEANRNRPGQQLPPLALDLRGTWPVAQERDEFVAQFQRELEVAEEAHA